MPINLSWMDRHQNVLLGICGETGELIDYLKKNIFHGHTIERDKLIAEMGDICFYISNLCHLYGVGFDRISQVETVRDWSDLPDLLIRLYVETGNVCSNLLLSSENGTHLDNAMRNLEKAFGYLKAIARGQDIDMEVVFAANVEKLNKRYPQGFDPQRSQERTA